MPLESWSALACSADGTKLVAVSLSGLIYTSPDFGTNWMTNNAPPEAWSSAACSADGTKLVATAGGDQPGGFVVGPIYTSANSGTNWVSNNVPSRCWTSVASSADGSRLVAGGVAGPSGALYTSSNSETVWNPSRAPADVSSLVVSSADGTKLTATGGYIFPGPIDRSSDSGATWQINNAPSTQWVALASSADGGSLLAARSDGQVYATVPALSVSNAGGNLTLAWPAGAAFQLQQNSDPTTTNWATVTNGPVIANGQSQVTVSAAGVQGFYRLIHPGETPN